MSNKHRVIAMQQQPGRIQVVETGQELPLQLPEGCVGILFVFESKKSAHEHFGKDITTVRVQEDI